MAENKVKIGTLHITEDYEYTDRGFQTASWWKTMNIHPQSVDVMGTFSGGKLIGYSWTLGGTVIADNFQSSMFGHVAPYDQFQNAGSPAQHHVYSYDGYPLAELFAVHKGELKDGHGFIVPEPGLYITTRRYDKAHRMHKMHNPTCKRCERPIRLATKDERFAAADGTVASMPQREYMHELADEFDHEAWPNKESFLDYIVPGVMYEMRLDAEEN